MCVCVSEWRKERSDKATERGVGPRMARQRKRWREKRGRTSDGSVDGKMEAGVELWGGDWVKAKTGRHLCQLGWRDRSLSRAGTNHCSLTVQKETPHLHT